MTVLEQDRSGHSLAVVSLEEVVIPTGFEPVTLRLGI
jgi:hypothetical protein